MTTATTTPPAPEAPATTVRTGPFAGLGALTRLALRRDRVRLSVFAVLTMGFAISVISAVTETYGTEAEQREFIESATDNAVGAIFSGPDLGVISSGRAVVTEMLTMVAVIVAIGSLLLVIRYSRTEEESGRAELVASAAVGRHARLASAILVVGLVNLAIGLVISAALLGFDLPAGGSLTVGIGVMATGWLFTAIGAVTAQIFEHARPAIGAAVGVFAVLFAVRSIGDTVAVIGDGEHAANSLSWLSPMGWVYHSRPFADERWWVLLIIVLLAGLLVITAAALSQRRDVEAGLLPARLGRREATALLAGPWSFAGRLHRGGLIGTAVALTLFTGSFGALTHDIGEMSTDHGGADAIARLGGSSVLADSWLAWTLSIVGLITAIFVINTVLRLRTEETALRSEHVLAAAVRPWQWASAHLLWAVGGAFVLLLLAGTTIGVVHGARAEDLGEELPRLIGAALVQLPAVLLMAGLALALYSIIPRLAIPLAWAAVIGGQVLTQFGAAFDLPQMVMNLSPFTHTPSAPGTEVAAMPLVLLSVAAVVLTGLGFGALRNRDSVST